MSLNVIIFFDIPFGAADILPVGMNGKMYSRAVGLP